MKHMDVTPAVWDRILSARAGLTCLCCGDWSPQEQQALDLYGPLVGTKQVPRAFAQIGQSLDGRVATASGDAKDVSGTDGLAHLHRLRALADAVVIGVKTALHDDPQLTVRLARGENPARVIIDPTGRLPDNAKALQDCGARRIIIQSVDRPRPKGIEVITLPCAGWISAYDIMQALRDTGLYNLLIEGGAITIAQFLEADLLTRLHIAVAPLIIGAGPQSLSLKPVRTLASARRPNTKTYCLGTDVLFDCNLNPNPQPTNFEKGCRQ